MTRKLAAVVLMGFLACIVTAQQPAPRPPKEPNPSKEEEPPEEDATVKEKEYSFNPLQAANEVKVGLFYMKRGKYKAASQRFDEATKWDPNSAEAYLNLGEAREKLKDAKGAKAAYEKFLQLAPDDKNADSVRKKLKN